MNTLKHWMKLATAKEKELLAKKAGTSVAYLRHLAMGRRKCGTELAFKIEQVTAVTPAFLRLEYVPKESLSPFWRKAQLDTTKEY